MDSGKIFINYRREDSRGDSGRIYDFLCGRFPGRVFRDVGSLEPGADWQQAIGRVIGQSDAALVVIGCSWLGIKGGDGLRRLDDPADTVRREIFAALQRNITVIPVLVGGAEMPKVHDLPPDLQPLCSRNALAMSEQDWPECCQKLARALELAMGSAAQPVAPVIEKKQTGSKWLLALAAAAAIVLFTSVAAVLMSRQPNASVPAAAQRAQVQTMVAAPIVAPEPQRRSAQLPAIQQFPEPRQAPVERPAPPPVTPASMIGIWGAVVNTNGATLNEVVELYGDQSFRVLLNGMPQAVGRWQSDGLGQVALTNGTNFVTGLHFSCGSRANEDGSGAVLGNCSDVMNNVWSFSMSRGVGTPMIVTVPRVDVSQLSLAERAAFVQVLSTRRCSCPCGMSVYMCLQKDQSCQYSPAIARNALMGFLRATHGG